MYLFLLTCINASYFVKIRRNKMFHLTSVILAPIIIQNAICRYSKLQICQQPIFNTDVISTVCLKNIYHPQNFS